MWPAIVGGAIGAAGSLLGGSMSARVQKQQAEKDRAMQREFAQQGIRWRVEDAKAAGLHPLYALGAQTMGYAPSYVGEDPMGRAVAEAGQSIGNAVARTLSPLEAKSAQLDLEWKKAQIKRTEMETYLDGIRAAEIGRSLQGARGAPGYVESSVVPEGQQPMALSQGAVDVQAVPRASNAPGKLWSESGYIPGMSLVKFPDFDMYLPSSGLGGESWTEVMENVPMVLWPGLIEFNRKIFGESWSKKVANFFVHDPARRARSWLREKDTIFKGGR